MNKDLKELLSFVGGFFIVLVILFSAISIGSDGTIPYKKAIELGCGQYNTETGVFETINIKTQEETKRDKQ